MPTRSQAAKSPSRGRFARPSGPSARRPAAPSRRPAIPTRRKPQKSGLAKAFDTLGGVLPSAGAKKSRRGTTGGGRATRSVGLAMFAGAAGLAVKNRDKLGAMMRRSGSDDADAPPAGQPATPAVTGDAATTDAVRPADPSDRPPT